MPETARFEQIGQVLKSNGTDGQVIIGLRGLCAEDISEKEPVFIYFDGLPVPFFIKEMFARSASKLLVRFIDVDTLADAEEIVGRGVFYPEDALEDEAGFQDFTGWTLKNQDGMALGTIEGIEDIPGNPCLEVGTEKGTVLVPLHEDLVVEIDEGGRVLTMAVPEGLIP